MQARSTSYTRTRSSAISRFNANSSAGFTLLELLVVLGILALLAAVAGPSVLRYMGKARTETAKAQIASISTAVELYALDMGAAPSSEVGLGALIAAPQGATRWRGPYLKNANGLIDPWGDHTITARPGSMRLMKFSLMVRITPQAAPAKNRTL